MRLTSRRRACGWVFAALSLITLSAPSGIHAAPTGAAPATRTLRVVTDNNYPPYVSLGADGRPEGFVVDLWKLWEAKSGVRVEFTATNWAEAQRTIHDGRADVIDMIFRTPVREQLLDFSKPYATLPVSIYVDASIQGVKDSKGLAGFNVAVQRGDACVDALTNAGVANLKTYQNYEEMLNAAEAGDVRMFCMDDEPASYYLYLRGEHLRFSRAFKLYEGQFHWAVQKGDRATFELVSDGMRKITPQELQALRDKWFSHPFEIRPYVRVIQLTALAATAILGAAGLWIWSMRRVIRARTAEMREQHAELQHRTEELISEKGRLRAIIDSSPDAIVLKDVDGVYLDCNEAAASLVGRTRDEVIGQREADIILSRDVVEHARRSDLQVLRDGVSQKYEASIPVPGGGHRLLEVFKVAIGSAADHARSVLLVARDITERRQAEQELRVAAVAFDAHEGIMIVNPEGLIERVNGAFTRITGLTPDEALGRAPRFLLTGLRDAGLDASLRDTLDRSGHWQAEVDNQLRDGRRIRTRLSFSLVRDSHGLTTHVIGHIDDITAEKDARETANRLKLFDPLTELPNRQHLDDRIEQALRGCGEHGEHGAVMMLDLDFFRKVNDSLGHSIGDELLVDMARRIGRAVGEAAVLARFSGDSFVVLAERLGHDRTLAASRAQTLAEGIRQAIEAPATIDGHKLVCTGSIGIVMFGEPETGSELLLRQAELAMYKCKNSGRNMVRFFEDAMQQEIDRRHWIEEELRDALAQEQLVLYYQLQVDADERPLGAEALVRWVHPKRGIVSPADFIPLAEETGLIEPIGRWSLRRACQLLARWSGRPDLCHMTIAVNVSPRQFRSERFVDDVLAEVQRAGAPITQLKLEVTESLAIDNFEQSIAKLRRLRDSGCAISLDDFGTGNSSLNYLTRLPLSQLKIDKSFVDNLPHSTRDAMVAQTIVAMGHGLGLDVIAEGVEDAAQRQCLADMGCRAFQGYLFGRPLPVEVFEATLQTIGIPEGE